MNKEEIDNLLTAANKRAARSAMNDWIQDELRSEIRGVGSEIAKAWVKNNRKALEAEFHQQMKSGLKRIVSDFLRQY